MLSSSLHIAEGVANVYDRVEAYEVCGEELREAYVGLKRLCTAAHRPAAQDAAAPAAQPPPAHAQAALPAAAGDVPSTAAPTAQGAEADVQKVERHLGHTVLEDLERSVASPEFVRQLKRSRQCPHSGAAGTEELDALLGEYVIVTKEDAVAAMSSYLAAWLSNVPEAQKMDPEELQRAVLHGVKDLKRSRFSQVLTWGKYAYRGAAFAYSAFTVYNNPWLVRAVVATLWSAGSVLATAVF